MYVSFGYDADFFQLSGQAARIFYDFRPSKKKDVSRPRPLHFLAPPLFFIFYEQRFLTLRRCSYNNKYV